MSVPCAEHVCVCVCVLGSSAGEIRKPEAKLCGFITAPAGAILHTPSENSYSARSGTDCRLSDNFLTSPGHALFLFFSFRCHTTVKLTKVATTM